MDVIQARLNQYHIGGASSRANNYYFQSVTNNNDRSKKVPFYGKISTAWTSRLFQLNACNYCDDLYAEVADASFMDAWLPEYMNDYQGHSIITVRNPEIHKIIEQGIKEKTCVLENLPIEKVLSSQESQWRGKSQRLRAELAHAEKKGKYVPATRQKANILDYRRMTYEIITQNWLHDSSKRLWPTIGNDLPHFQRKLILGLIAIKISKQINRVARIIKDPARVKIKWSSMLKSSDRK